MIIVSQDKKAIVNFDNINEIRVAVNKIITYNNTYRSTDDWSDTLGTYATEERAKEVLQEIQDSYSAFKILPFMNLSILNGYKGRDLKNLISYQMPKE